MKPEHATRQLIEYIDAYFDVVLIVEHIDESLVLMKRRLCWPMKDILYHTVLPPLQRSSAGSQNQLKGHHLQPQSGTGRSAQKMLPS